jgi:hypothetical protein
MVLPAQELAYTPCHPRRIDCQRIEKPTEPRIGLLEQRQRDIFDL